MNFGYVSTSFVDSPYGTASVVFFDECNMSCSYCHQRNLLEGGGTFSLDQVIDKIQENKFRSGKPRTDWLILSGGEPTMFPEIVAELVKVGKTTGRRVGAWTNFTLPGAAETAMQLLDWVNVDYKWLFDEYPAGSQILENLTKIYLNKPDIFRLTTIVDGKKHSGAYLRTMGEILASRVLQPCGAKKKVNWRFAPFRFPPDGSLQSACTEYQELSMAELTERIKNIGFDAYFNTVADGHD